MKIKWITLHEYVDTQTGETLNKTDIENNYIITKTLRYVEYNNFQNRNHQVGYIKLIHECRKLQYKQQKLF